MISSLEVGARFIIQDDASPALKRIADELKVLQEGIERTKVAFTSLARTTFAGVTDRLQAVNAELKGMGDLGAGAADKMALSFDRAAASMSMSLARVSEQMAAIKAEGASIGSTGILAGSAAAASSGRWRMFGRHGDGGGGGGVHFGGAGVPLPADQHARMSGTPAVVAGAAVAYGTYEEAKIQDFVNRIFLTGGITSGSETLNPLYKTVRDAILKTYTMTGLPLEQIEEGILTGTRGLAGIELKKRLELMPGLLAASATEAYLKDGTSIPEAMQAFVGLAHMEGKYSPDQIAKLADHFAYLSTTTPLSVKQIEMAASYAVPMLRTADFDPEQLLLMVTSMQRAGIMNSKSGTWLSQLATQSFPGTSLMSKMLFAKHESALKDLGLIDDKDQPTWFTDGKPDLVKMTSIAGDRISAMDPAHRLAIEKALWGQQGGRAAGFFADPTNRAIMGAVAGEEKNFISGEAMWKQSLENSPIVQFRTAFAGLNTELINLGSNVLPYVTGTLKAANEQMGGKGELGLLAGSLAAWATKGLWWNTARSGLGAALGYAGAGAEATLGSVFAPVAAIGAGLGLVAMTKPNRLDPLRYTGDAPGIYERSWRAQQDYLRDPEGARGRAMMSPDFRAASSPSTQAAAPAPVVNVAPAPVQISATPVTLTMPGMGVIAAGMIKWMVRDGQTTFGPSFSDGSALPHGVDHGLIGHH